MVSIIRRRFKSYLPLGHDVHWIEDCDVLLPIGFIDFWVSHNLTEGSYWSRLDDRHWCSDGIAPSIRRDVGNESTAFSGSEDPSMNIRLRNRELIRFYIQSNPVGYGLGGTGYLGNKYTPNTFIGTFATDLICQIAVK